MGRPRLSPLERLTRENENHIKIVRAELRRHALAISKILPQRQEAEASSKVTGHE